MNQWHYRIEDDDFYKSGFFPGKTVMVLVDHLGCDVVVSDQLDQIKILCERWNRRLREGYDITGWNSPELMNYKMPKSLDFSDVRIVYVDNLMDGRALSGHAWWGIRYCYFLHESGDDYTLYEYPLEIAREEMIGRLTFGDLVYRRMEYELRDNKIDYKVRENFENYYNEMNKYPDRSFPKDWFLKTPGCEVGTFKWNGDL